MPLAVGAPHAVGPITLILVSATTAVTTYLPVQFCTVTTLPTAMLVVVNMFKVETVFEVIDPGAGAIVSVVPLDTD